MAPWPPCTSEDQKYDVYKTWPELLGVTGYEACKVIEKWNSNIKAVPIMWNMIRTMDWCTNRVWVNLDKPDGVVVEVPKIG
ncbi:trypsin/subtilisin inhibitor [Artemisia annua]|uniref:Trypsin/subtilisin inhibitor n=1 Tax=Artemisia annua TaxID=35608 RepID=A0A2U1KLF8_ARTAN|nr:trypsin/subtilisin inhibitor [Artemisia annua]